MANANKPMGLRPIGYMNGSPWDGRARTYYVAASDGNAYAPGDPVTLAGSADPAGVAASVTLATAGTGNVITGVVLSAGGLKYGSTLADPNNLYGTGGTSPTGPQVIAAGHTSGYYIMVADDPNIIFEAQEDSVGANLAITDVGSNINLVAGTNNGFMSGWMLDSTPLATTSTLQCHLLGLAPRSDNAVGQYAKWYVRINNHSYAAGVAGV